MTGVGKPVQLDRLKTVHLVGIGGMHMSAIASILLARGVTVTGSDLAPSRYTARLEKEGATVFAGHNAQNLGAPDLVVATVAARDDNPEIVAARARGIPLVIRAEMVATLMQGRTAVCAAGTHGKTTTSGLLAYALSLAGRSPTYLLGGDSIDLGRNAAPGSGPEIVVEADEYAEAFLHYEPDVAVITNVEVDHLDYFATEARILDAFRGFIARLRLGGVLAACADSPRLMAIVGDGPPPGVRVETYALGAAARWTAVVEETAPVHRFRVLREGAHYGRFSTPLAGSHNVANCLGAIVALDALGLDRGTIVRAVAGYHGAKRRFELVGEARGVTVMDDYAHHPREVQVTIAAAHERFPERRLVVVFQPHTYSRTRYLLQEFSTCFEDADALVLLPTFAARETADAGLDAGHLAGAVTAPRPVLVDGVDAAVRWLCSNTRAGDVVLTMGAGTVDAVAHDLREALSR